MIRFLGSSMVLLTVVALVAGSCALPDDFVKADGPVGQGGAGGTGGGAVGGSGGTPPCDETTQGACVAVDAREFGGSGRVTVTDMAYVDNSVAVVGTFTGTVDFGGNQLSAGAETRGFFFEHNGSSVVEQIMIPEATEGSRLHVAYNTSRDEIAIGGNYGPGSSCGGNRGIFIRRLDNMYADPHAPICQEVDATVLEIGGIGMSDLGWINLAGTIDGTLDTLTSNNVDGFTFELNPAGDVTDAFLFGGPGDIAIRALLPNEIDTNQWVYAGDFSGQLNVAFEGESEMRSADGMRDLFVMVVDRNPADAQLALVTMGATGGNHRAVALATNPLVTGRMHLLANIIGDIDVGIPLSSEDRPTALLLNFDAPDGIAAGYEYFDHYTISADALDMIDVSGAATRIHIGGHASGTLSITKSDQPAIDYEGCTNDAFLAVIEPGMYSVNAERCGDGSQILHAVSRHAPGKLAAALTVPADGSIDLGDGVESTTTERSFLLTEP